MELVNLVKNPVPSGATAGHFKSFDGAPLRFAIWQATRKPRRGTICLFGGRTEFIEKYFEVIADLRRRGFAVDVQRVGSGPLQPRGEVVGGDAGREA